MYDMYAIVVSNKLQEIYKAVNVVPEIISNFILCLKFELGKSCPFQDRKNVVKIKTRTPNIV